MKRHKIRMIQGNASMAGQRRSKRLVSRSSGLLKRDVSENRGKDLPHNWTEYDWDYACQYFNHCCAVCQRPAGDGRILARDHWYPLSIPGCPGTVPTNMVPLCHGIDGCNNQKSNHDPYQWLVNTYGLIEAKAIMKRIQTFFRTVRQ